MIFVCVAYLVKIKFLSCFLLERLIFLKLFNLFFFFFCMKIHLLDPSRVFQFFKRVETQNLMDIININIFLHEKLTTKPYISLITSLNKRCRYEVGIISWWDVIKLCAIKALNIRSTVLKKITSLVKNNLFLITF